MDDLGSEVAPGVVLYLLLVPLFLWLGRQPCVLGWLRTSRTAYTGFLALWVSVLAAIAAYGRWMT